MHLLIQTFVVPSWAKKEGDRKGNDNPLSLFSLPLSAPIPKEEGDGEGSDHPLTLSSVPLSVPIPKEEGDGKVSDHPLSLQQHEDIISLSPIEVDPDIWLPHFNIFWSPQ